MNIFSSKNNKKLKKFSISVFRFFIVFCLVLSMVYSPSSPVNNKVPSASAATTTVILTSGTTWAVPADWNDNANWIEVIGGGGSGKSAGGVLGAAGGGGGGYSLSRNVNMPESTTVGIAVGGVAGDTYVCNSTSNCASIAGSAVVTGAKGGATATGTAPGGAGGASASGIATGAWGVKFSGGTGGVGVDLTVTGGGGGGAAGPRGAGTNGGAGGGTGANHGGGGGGGNGGATANGTAGTTTGGAGAAGSSATGSGAGGNANNGTAGTAGTGGGGGGGDNTFSGGNGATSTSEWSGTHGAGGGGGGAGIAASGDDGGNGGLYGAGGGGGWTGGTGAQGIIVITYIPTTVALTTVFITSGTTWTVPADWNSTENFVEVIGGGGGGNDIQTNGSGGGGGGAYALTRNVSLTPGGSATIQVGAGGNGTPTAGTDTWFNGASCAASSTCAKGGSAGGTTTGGAGGLSTTSIGSIRYRGGTGGGGNNTGDTSGGGGGAAGRRGLGMTGGAGSGTATEGGGGGGAGNGGGANGTAGAAAAGGAGGNGYGASGGGTAGNNVTCGSGGTGGAGTAATGGGGGGGDKLCGGGAGAMGQEWDSTHGSGGGGGGSGSTTAGAGLVGGAGGTYGGGGGGGGTTNLGGAGAAGVIAVTYRPVPVTANTTGTQTANLTIGATNQHIGGAFSFSSAASLSITGVTITESGTVNASTNLDNIKLFYESDTSAPYDCASESYGGIGGETQFGSTDADGFSAADGTSAFTGSVGITSTSTLCVYPVLDVGAGAAADETIEISLNASTDFTTASSLGTRSGTFPVAISGTTTIRGTTTLGDGTDSNATPTIGPGGSITEIDRFSLATNSGTDTVTGLTVTLAGDANAYTNIATVSVQNQVGGTLCSNSLFASNAVPLTSCGISVTTTPTDYIVKVTPKTHPTMPAVPGASYATTATVTSITATNSTTGTDVDSDTVTVDNLSPNNATATSGSASSGKVTLAWTASNSADISQSVILRWAASTPGSEVPVEGNSYTANDAITTATVACVLTSTASQSHSGIIDGTGGTAGCNTSALTNGQDYSYKVFSKDSRGNYDVGPTFTGSPFTPPAPTARYWVGGTGSWDGTTTHWSTSSGGSGGASIPTSTLDAVFDASSGGGTVTIAAGNTGAKSFDSTGFTGTFDGSDNLSIYGDWTFGASITNSYTGSITFAATSGTKTITSNGKSFGGEIIFNGAGGTWQPGDTLTTTGNLTLTAGTFSGNNQTVAMTGTAQTITGGFTFYNLTRTGTATKTDSLTFMANQTITGTLTLTGNSAINRLAIFTDEVGTSRTLTAANVSLTNVDFYDITGAGVAAPFTGTSLGNALGNSGITFTTPATMYWKTATTGAKNWSDSNWYLATNGGGGAGRVPLAQDTAIFDANSIGATSTTISIDMPIMGKDINFTGVTNSPTLAFNSAYPSIYGSLTLGSGMTLSGNRNLSFSARSAINITTAGNTFTNPIDLNVRGGSVTLQDAFSSTNSLNAAYGDFNANNYNVTVTTFSGSSSSGALTMGSGTWTLTGSSGTLWNPYSSAITAGTSTIKITDTSASGKTFDGGGKTYNNIWYAPGTGTGALTIAGSNTFAEFKDTGTAAHSLLFTSGTTQTMTSFTANSASAGNLLTINSTSAATHNLTLTGGGTVSSDYLNIQYSVASPGSTWYAGANSTNNNGAGSGWIFTTPPSVTAGTTGTQVNLSRNTTNQHVGGAFSFVGTANINVTGITITESGTINGSTNLDNIKLYYESDTSAPYDCASESYAGGESQFGSTDTDGFSGANGTSAFTATVGVTSTSTLCVYPVLDVTSGASAGETIEISIAATSDYTTSTGIKSGTPSIAGTTTIRNQTTLADGTNPGDSTIAPDGTVTDIDAFTLTTDTSTDTITALTVTLDVASSYNNLSKVEVTTNSNVDACTDIDNPASTTLNFTGCSLAVTTSPTTFKIRITPKTHANMPAVPGASYATTARVTALTTATNSTTGTDGASATITVDNLSPNNASATSGSAGTGNVTLAWTASNSADISQSVVLRWAASSPGSEVPVEGTAYTAGNTITTATVACVLTSTASQSHSGIIDGTGGTAGCNTSALTGGQNYSYVIFSKDSNGNYSQTGTAVTGNPFTVIAPAIRYWVGGTGSWDGTTTHWSTTSGGSGGASIPDSTLDAVFDASSGGGTVTIASGNTGAKSFDSTGFTGTFAGSSGLSIYGDWTFGASITNSYTGTVTFKATSGTKNITSNGKSFGGYVVFNGVGGTWQLVDALNTGGFPIYLTNGIFTTNNQTIASGNFESSNANTRTLNLGSTIWTLGLGSSWNVSSTLTLNPGTSTLAFSGSASFAGGGLTYATVSYNGLFDFTIQGVNTFANLSIITGATKTSNTVLSANQTITGTLTLTGNSASNRLLVQSNIFGTSKTLTAAAVSLTNVDFQDITGAGAASPFTGTSLGDAQGNSGITFTTPASMYWKTATTGSKTWSTVGNWFLATNGGGGAGRVPLPQDTAVFDANSIGATSTTISLDMPRVGSINFTGVANTPTLAFDSTSNTIYGSMTLVSGMNISGTNTTTFAKRGAATLTSAGKTLTQAIQIDAIGGSLTLQDSLTISRATTALILNYGTFDMNNFNVTLTGLNTAFDSGNTNTRTLNMGSGTFEITNTAANGWDVEPSTNMTLNAGTSTIKNTNSNSNQFAFYGGGKTYYNLWLDRGASAWTNIIYGSNTFNQIKDTGYAGHWLYFEPGTTQTLTSATTPFLVSGADAGNKITIDTYGSSNTHALTLTGGGYVDADYLNIQHSVASPGSTWYAGANSTNNQGVATTGSGWIFTPRPVTTLGDGTDGANSTIAPGASATEIDRFSLATNAGTDTVTGLTVTLAPAGAFNNLLTVGVYTTADALKCESSSWGGDLTVELTSCAISVTTTPTDYVVKITPKTHANMDAPATGTTYATTATVTSITRTNSTTGTDIDSATITVDNTSPAVVTSATVIPGDTVADLAWTNPADADVTTGGTILVLRRATSAVASTPVEGTTYSVGNTIGTATVACVVAGSPPATTCQDTGLTNDTAYHYKIYSQDSRGNYVDTGTVPTGSPVTPSNKRYWVGGSASWDGTAGSKWATTSGGTGGASIPTSSLNAVFDGNSGAVTVTIATGNTGANDVTFTGFTGTLAGSDNLSISGSLTLGAGMTNSFTGSLNFIATSGPKTVTSNGKAITGDVSFSGSGGSWQLVDDITANNMTLGLGTLDANGQDVTVGSFYSSNSSLRTLTMGSGQWTLTHGNDTVWSTSTATNMTLNKGSNPVIVNYNGINGETRTIMGATALGMNNPDFNITAGSDTVAVSSAAGSLNFTGFSGNLSAATRTIYGGLILSSSMTTTTSVGGTTFGATSGTHMITSNGVTINFPIQFNGVGGTWQIGGDLILGSTKSITLTNGTFNANNYNVTAASFSSNNTNTRGLTMGSGTWTLVSTSSSNPWWIPDATGLTFNANTSTIKYLMNSSSVKGFTGGGLTYYNFWADNSGTGAIEVIGSNTFNNFKDTGAVAHNLLFTAGTTQTMNTFTVSGTTGNVITINSSDGTGGGVTSTATHALTITGGALVDSDYLNIQYSVASPGSTWYAGANSTNNNGAGSGWTFTPTPCHFTASSGSWSSGSNWTYCHGGGGIPNTTDNVIIDASKTVTLDTATPVLNSLLISGTLNTSGSDYALNAKTINIDSTGALTANGSTITLSGTTGTLFTKHSSGTFTKGTSTVVFSGNGDATLNSGTINFQNMTSSGTGTKTLGGATTVSGNLVLSAGTLALSSSSFTVTGTSSITGTLNDASITGTNTFTGAVTINAGGIWNASGNPAFTFRGGFINNSSSGFTSGIGNYTFDTNAQTVSGSQSFSIYSVVNNISTSTGLTLSGAQPTMQSLTQGSDAVLTFSGTVPAISGLYTSGIGDTVNYTSGSAQNIIPTTYTNLVKSGAGIATVGTPTSVVGDLTISSGTLELGTSYIEANGTTSITGTLSDSSITGTNTFNGDVTINSGGAWVVSGDAPFSFVNAGLNRIGTGTFTGGSGLYTFNGETDKTITGNNAFTITNLTNSHGGTNGLIFSGVYPSVDNLLQGEGAILTFSGTVPVINSLIGTGTSPHTVKYAGSSQTVLSALKWVPFGTGFSIESATAQAIAKLTPSRMAYINDNKTELKTLDFDGTNWSQTGNVFVINGATGPAMAGLSSNRVAFIDDASDSLRTYEFDGTDWAQVGNSLEITGVIGPSITRLSPTKIAFVDAGNKDLRTYDFNGTDWTQAGNDLNIGMSKPSIAGLSTSRVAFIDDNNDKLRTYDFDGTNWSQTGNDLVISGTVAASLASLTSSKVAFVDEGNAELRTYDFDGTDWSQAGASFAIAGVGGTALTALDSSKVALIDGVNFTLQNYRFDGTNYHHLVINSSGTATLGNNIVTKGDLTISSGTLASNSKDITIGGNYSNSGTFSAGSGTVIFDAAEIGHTISGSLTGSSKFSNVVFDNPSGAWSFGSNAVEVAKDFTVTKGAVTAPSTTLSIGGDFINTPGTNSSFVHNSGTVILNTTKTAGVSGNTTFNNFTVATGNKKVGFDSDNTFTINGLLTLTGASYDNPIYIDSINGYGQWLINHQGTESITYVHLDNAGCHASSSDITMGNTSVDGSHNDRDCWIFPAVNKGNGGGGNAGGESSSAPGNVQTGGGSGGGGGGNSGGEGGGQPSGAAATATVSNNVVITVDVTAGGNNYSTPPSVTFCGGGGSNAAGTASVSGGHVTGVEVTNGGSGYTGVPIVQFNQACAGGGSGGGGGGDSGFLFDKSRLFASALSSGVSNKIALTDILKAVFLPFYLWL